MAIENKKQLIFIVLGVVAGVFAVLLTSNYVKNEINNQTTVLSEQYEAKQREVVAQLKQESDAKAAAFAEQLNQVKQEQAENLKNQLASLKQQMDAQAKAAAQAASQQVKKDERKRSKTMLSYKTPAGKRAVTVQIDSLAAVGGLLNAGDFVDIIAHLDVPAGKEKKTVTAMVFQSLEVLAVNTNMDEPGYYDEQQKADSLKVTFAVDPQEAGLLAFSDKNGKLELALRSPNELDKQMVKASTWKTLADYVLENQGDQLDVPDETGASKTPKTDDAKPYIQVFKGGKEL